MSDDDHLQIIFYVIYIAVQAKILTHFLDFQKTKNMILNPLNNCLTNINTRVIQKVLTMVLLF